MTFHSRARNVFILKKKFSPFDKALVLAVVKHISKVYNTAAVHNSTDYKQREAGEIPTEKYPNFPIVREKAIYMKEIAKSKTDNIGSNLVKKNFLPMQISRQAYIC